MTDHTPRGPESSPETDLDVATAAAWAEFTQTLAGLVADQGSRAIGVFVEEGAATVNRVRIDQDDDGDVWVLLRGNDGLPPALRLSRAAMAHARRLGWSRASGSSKHYARYFPASSEGGGAHGGVAVEGAALEGAGAVTTALQEVVGVLHPAFLSLSDDLRPTPPVRAGSTSRAGSGSGARAGSGSRREPPLRTAALASGVSPTDTRHLDRLVDQTLVAVLGREVERSECGDIDIDAGDGTVHIGWSTRGLVVPIVTPLAMRVPDTADALVVVNQLNRRHPGITFVLEGRAVLARIDLPGNPFDGALLINQLSRLCDLVIDHGAEIAERLGTDRPH